MVEEDPKLARTGGADDSPSMVSGNNVEVTLPAKTMGDVDLQVDGSDGLDRGSTVGRYTVLERIGSGGMGVVYAAFDPQLDRRIALKVMHPDARSSGDSGGKGRLLREAQAMAKLSHPNVITVHDVGTFGERVFVAMEFIEGCTLREWVKYSEHEWPEIVEAFVRAGRGLAAAHAAGLVHRDFKPDNVLMGNDGRVLVMDFGLARQASQRTGPVASDVTADRPASRPGDDSLSAEVMLTRSGALLGTPAYMAPEQHRGAQVGAAADQFGFCVALYEALYGERPFGGTSVTSVALNVLDGQIKAPPRDSRIPSWLRQVVLRGLRVEPDERYPSMDALLAELQRDPPNERRPWVAVATAVGVGGGIVATYVVLNLRQPDEGCRNAQDQLAGSWDQARSETLREAMLKTGVPHAEATWQTTSERLDAYADAWTTTFATRCRIDRERRATDPNRGEDAGVACLQARRVELDTLVDALADSDAVALEHAVSASQRLPSPEVCADQAALQDGSSHVRAPGLLEPIAKARTWLLLDHPREAAEVLGPLLSSPGVKDRPAARSEILLLAARAQRELGETMAAERSLRDALLSAAAVHRFDLEAKIWIELVGVVGLDERKYDEGRRLGLGAQAAISRAGGSPLLRAELLAVLGAIDQAQGRYDDALDRFEETFGLQRDNLPADDLRLAHTRIGIGLALEGLARYEAATEQHSAALATREQVLGAHHPDVALALVRLGASRQGAGRSDVAEAALIRARMLLDPKAQIAIDDLPTPSATAPTEPHATRSLDTPLELGFALDQLGLLHRAKEEFERAARLHARAAALIEKERGPDHRDLGYPLENLGLSLADQQRHAEGLTHLQRALEIWKRTLPEMHPDLGFAHLNLANSLWATGRFGEAHDHYSRALSIWEETLPTDHPLLGYALSGLGRVTLRSDPRAALELLERAAAIRNHEDEDRLNTAETNLLLGQALYRTGEDQGRAFELVVMARDIVGAYAPTDAAGLQAVLEGKTIERFTDQLVPAGLGVSNRRLPQ